MRILILDPYRKANYRISKDTNGGYGTANNFGNNLVPMILKYLLKKKSDYPSLNTAYTFSVLIDLGYNVNYEKVLPKNLDDYDLYIVVSSIVCCETELENIRILNSNQKKIMVIGPFSTSNPSPTDSP